MPLDLPVPLGPPAPLDVPVPLDPPVWLAALTDTERVGAALRAELVAGAGDGVRCQLVDLRARGARWRVRYRVVLTSAGGARSDVVLVGDVDPAALGALVGAPGGAASLASAGDGWRAYSQGVPGTDRWQVTLPALGLTLCAQTVDRHLPAAALLLDPASAGSLVERVLRSRALPGLRVDGCAVRAVRYVYGARCTVVLDLQVADGAGPATVVAKAHPAAEGARGDAALRALWATRLAGGDVVRIAEPLGYLADPGVLLQGAVPGDVTVRDLLDAARGDGDVRRIQDVLRRVADGLVALHTCGSTDPPPRTWADDIERVRRTAARMAPGWPSAAESVLASLDVLDRAAGTTATATGPRPSHGAFRPSQVLVDGDRVGFIDFDGFCLAEPERDLGRFCKALRKVAPGPAERLVEVLLSRYAQGAPLSVARVAAWEALDEIAGQAHRAATVRPAARGLEAVAPALDAQRLRLVPP